LITLRSFKIAGEISAPFSKSLLSRLIEIAVAAGGVPDEFCDPSALSAPCRRDRSSCRASKTARDQRGDTGALMFV